MLQVEKVESSQTRAYKRFLSYFKKYYIAFLAMSV